MAEVLILHQVRLLHVPHSSKAVLNISSGQVEVRCVSSGAMLHIMVTL